MKSREECELSVNAALAALAEDCGIENDEDTGKVLTLLMSTAALAMLAYRGLPYTLQSLDCTKENVRSKASITGGLLPQFDGRNPGGTLQ